MNLVGLIGATAGFMIYITIDEIIPTTCSKCSNQNIVFAMLAGILFVILLDLI